MSARIPSSRALGGLGTACCLTLLCAAFLLKGWTAPSENLLWMDEVYSLELSTKPVDVIVDLTRQDVHPPLYYLTLKAWLVAGRELAGRPSLFQARFLNIAAWILLGVALLPPCRRLFGPAWGLVAVTAVSVSAPCVQMTQDLRSYGFAFAGVTYCFVAVNLILRFPSRSATQAGVRWVGYAVAAAIAAWSHLLAWPILALIALLFSMAWRANANRSRLDLVAGGTAHLVLLVAALPWLVAVPSQIRYLESAPPTWMTPATLANLARVFYEWLPLGRDGAAATIAPGLGLLAGLGTLLPFAGMLLPARRKRVLAVGDGECGAARHCALAALALGLVYVGALWAGARWGWVHAFHGPRYPGLVAGIWAIGLVAASRDLSTRFGRRGLAGLLIAPWLVGSLLALAAVHRQWRDRQEHSLALLILEQVGPTAPPIVFSPPELEPFFPGTIAALEARPLRELPCLIAAGRDATLFLANRWKELDTPTSLLLHTAVAYGRIGEKARMPVPEATADFFVSTISATASEAGLATTWCPQGLSPSSRGALPAAAVEVDLADQRQSDGWSYLEFDRELRPLRWTEAPAARLRLPRSVPARGFRLVVEGTFLDGPGEAVVRQIGLLGSRDEVVEQVPKGPFAVTLAASETAGSGPDREVEIRCSALRDTGSSEGFRRLLGAQIRRAYLLPPE